MITRVAKKKDIPEIVDLLVTVFPSHARSCRHWEWSHVNGKGLAVVAESKGHIVGHYSFGYQPFQRHERTYLAGFGQQAAVHPEHRDLRTIAELIEFAEASSKCDFVFAFPNGNMAPIKERVLGWDKVLAFREWTLPLGDFCRQVRQLSGAESVRRLTTFSGLEIPAATDADSLTSVRDAEWLEWRYTMHPLNHYACFGAFENGRCEGVIVLKTYFGSDDRRGHILELNAQDSPAKLRLLSAAADYFETMGVSNMLVWGRYKPNQTLYEDLGFQPSSITNTLYAKALTEDSREALAADWSFDMGVSDVF